MGKITIIEHNTNDKDKVRAYFLKGEKGDTGDTGKGIASVEKTGTTGNIDTYTITFTDETTFEYEVANGEGATVIVDNLTDTSTDKALSANQGRVLKGIADTKLSATNIIDNLTSTSTTDCLSANQGKVLNDKIFIKALTSTLYFVDGTEPTLDGGYYYTNGKYLSFNGEVDSASAHLIFYYDASSKTIYYIASRSMSSNGKVQYYWKYKSNGTWAKTEREISILFNNTNAEIPTSSAVVDYAHAEITSVMLGYSDYTVSGSTEITVPFTFYRDEGYNLELDNNSVVIGSGITAVKISGQVNITPGSSGLKEVRIKRNSSGTVSTFGESYLTASSNKATINVAEQVINVSEGDIISMTYKGSANDVISYTSTFLTVEKVIA